ncbi:MAG: cation:proton antiporter [Dehalococcoidia bacterium]
MSLALILIVAKIAEGLAARFQQSSLAAFILTGILLGPVLGLVEPTAELSLFFGIGVIFLFFLVGADEIDIAGFAATIRGQFAVASAIAYLVPLGAGFAVLHFLLKFSIPSSISLGGLLALSSLGVAAKVLTDLGQLKKPLGLEIFTTVIIVEVVGLLLVSFTLNEGHSPQQFHLLDVGILLGEIVGFAIVAWLLASRLFTPVVVRLRRWLGGSQLTFGVLLATLFLTVVAAEHLGLHGSLGALLLGTALTGLPHRLRAEIMPGMRSLADGLFVPLFFSAVGLQLNLSFLSLPPLTIAAVAAVAVFGKLAGSVLGPVVARLASPLALASGLMSKGVVEVAVLLVMLEVGVISQEMFSLLAIIMLAYIFVIPPIIAFAVRRDQSAKRSTPSYVPPSFARYALEGIFVENLIAESSRFPSADLSVPDFLERWVVPEQQDYVTVDEDNKLAGVFSLRRLRSLPRDRWADLTVGDLIRRNYPLAYPNTSLDDVLEQMVDYRLSVIPVIDPDEGLVLGAVATRDVMELLIDVEEPAPEEPSA